MMRPTLLLLTILILSTAASAEILDYASSKSNALIVIGEDATAEDVIGSLGLATGMYASTPRQASALAGLVSSGMIELPDGLKNTVYVMGDVVELDSTTDRLEPVERLGNVKPVVTGSDTPSLASHTISTQKGTAEYKQYLRFETTTDTSDADYVASGYATLKQNDDDEVNVYLYFEEGKKMFEYELDFEGGLKSNIECVSGTCTSADERKLEDLESLDINILGTTFMVLTARATTDEDSITLNLIGEGTKAIFEEGETQVFNIGGKDYEITALLISDTQNKVKFKINSKTTKEYSAGDVDRTVDDLYIGINSILPNEAGEVATNDLVEIIIGKKSIEFKDTNYSDDVAFENININDNTITGSEVKIRASLDSEDTFKINDIKYRLNAESADFGDVFVKAGDTLRNNVRYPESMLTDDWDIRYFGSSVDILMYGYPINFIPKGDEAYKLYFTNTQGYEYAVPLLDNSDDEGNGFKYGSDDKQLRFFECTSSSDFCIASDDYFILTNSKTGYASGSDTSVTRILQYESIDEQNNIITFNDLAMGSLSATYQGTEGTDATGILSVGGVTYTFYVGGSTAYSIAFDQNDDGDVASDEVNIITMGGGILDIGSNQTADQNATGLDDITMTLVTLAKQFDEDGWLDMGLDETILITASELSNNEMDMELTPSATGIAKYKFPDDDAYFGSSAYGVSTLESDESGESDYIKITYPIRETLPQVYLTFGDINVVPLSIAPLLGDIPLEAFLDQPTMGTLLAQAQDVLGGMVAESKGVISVPKPEQGDTTKLDSQVTLDELDAKSFVVLLGGPCVNDYVAELAVERLTPSCAEWQDLEGRGMLQSITTSYGPVLIVAGYSGADTMRASLVLQDIDAYRQWMEGKEKVFVAYDGVDVVFT